MERVCKIFFMLLALYLTFHIGAWYGRAHAGEVEDNIKIIKETAQIIGVDESICLAFAKIESNFKTKAFNDNKNSKGSADVRQSIGLFQPTRALAKAFGVSDLYDPRQNALAAIKFIKYLITKYPKRSLHTIAQMYNLGETRFFKGKTAKKYADKFIFYYNSFSAHPNIVKHVSLHMRPI